MSCVRLFAPALAGCFAVSVASAQYADSVVSYVSGSGFASGYTDPTAALGEPSRVTPGAYGGPVDPFSPPYLSSQLVSIGAGGSLTLQFNSPIRHDVSHPYGVDFIVFGSAGFTIVNGDYTGGGVTDGSLFANGLGITRVSVSADGHNFFTLNPALAPAVDSLFPTDGSGNFFRAVNPGLTTADFANLDLAGIRALYAGSGGGAGFDLSWAQDASGHGVILDSVNYVRFDVLSDKVEIDGVTVVPEPSLAALGLAGALLAWWRQRRQP